MITFVYIFVTSKQMQMRSNIQSERALPVQFPVQREHLWMYERDFPKLPFPVRHSLIPFANTLGLSMDDLVMMGTIADEFMDEATSKFKVNKCMLVRKSMKNLNCDQTSKLVIDWRK